MTLFISSSLGQSSLTFTVTILNNPPYLSSAITPNPYVMSHSNSYQILLPIVDVDGDAVSVILNSALPSWVTLGAWNRFDLNPTSSDRGTGTISFYLKDALNAASSAYTINW